jgi:hypothetical protein
MSSSCSDSPVFISEMRKISWWNKKLKFQEFLDSCIVSDGVITDDELKVKYVGRVGGQYALYKYTTDLLYLHTHIASLWDLFKYIKVMIVMRKIFQAKKIVGVTRLKVKTFQNILQYCAIISCLFSIHIDIYVKT